MPMLPYGTHLALHDVEVERAQQNLKWGERNHPDGTGPDVYWTDSLGNCQDAKEVAELATERCQEHFDVDHTGTWLDIALEEVAEAFAECDPSRLRAELVQAAAVLVAWIEAIDRNLALISVNPNQE
ncbi:MAG TPA: hypothetical protein VIK31_03205 [Propionibacteriaceae bacterium]